MQSWLPVISGSGGALTVLALGIYLFLTGKLHSDTEFSRLAEENRDLKTALETERTTNNELARAGGVTAQLVAALAGIASGQAGRPAPRTPGSKGPE